jgi:hypothetical protein
MAMLRLLGTLVVLVALAFLPCFLALLLIRLDELVEFGLRAVRRGMRQLRRRQEPEVAPIEQVAADLRRLNRQRSGVATRSSVWFEAVSRAYDDRLAAACLALDVPQHLAELEGIDLEIERLRVEAKLSDAGLVLRASGSDEREDRYR